MKIHIDFETKSELNIWDVGAWAYSAHPSTEILCMAYAVDDDENIQLARKFTTNDAQNPYTLDALLLASSRGDLLVAHNAFFEQCIWKNILVKRFGWPEVPIERWRCTMAKANVVGLPRSLEKAAKAIGLPIEKDTEGRRIMLKLCKPRNPTKSNPKKWHDDPEDFEKLYKYCMMDVAVERAIDKALPELNPVEQKVWFLDQKINMRGVKIDKDFIEAAIQLSEENRNELIERTIRISKGYLDGVSKRARVLRWCADQGVILPDYTKATVYDYANRSDTPTQVREVLNIRLQLGKTSIKKYNAMQASIGSGSRLRDTLMYHAAITGRWGGKLVQLQNLPRGNVKDTDEACGLVKLRDLDLLRMLYDDVSSLMSSCIRGAIIAKPEHTLFVADYSSIEVRVLLWLAGDEAGLKKYRDGEDLYVDMAKSIYLKNDISKEERALGKRTIVGCGYGMGVDRFWETCKITGLNIGRHLAEVAVYAYHKQYQLVLKFWREMGAIIRSVILSKKTAYHSKFQFSIVKNFLIITLPSGRNLFYHKPKITEQGISYMSVHSQTKQYEETRSWGSKFVENVTQAVARDIMAWAMLRLEKSGASVILTVHDEIIVEAYTRNDNEYSTELMALMLTTITALPEWAKGCPIGAEGWFGRRYKKG